MPAIITVGQFTDRPPLTTTAQRRKLPEGSFIPFLMDFNVAGATDGALYPAVLKPLDSRSQSPAESARVNDYLAYRFVVGLARSYTVEALGLMDLNTNEAAQLLADVQVDKPGKYYRLKRSLVAGEHDPEKSLLNIDRGRSVALRLTGELTDDVPDGQSSIEPIQGSITIRVPTIVTNFQIANWFRSTNATAPKNKAGVDAILLSGRKNVPLLGSSGGSGTSAKKSRDKGAAKDGQ